MKAKIIKNEAEYNQALAHLDSVFGAKPGTPEGDEAELLSALIEMYEESAFPIGLPSPVEAIKFRMEQQEMKAKDLIPFLGSASKVSEVLSGKRELSLTMIRKLVNELGIPAEVLLQQPGAVLPSQAVIRESRHFPVAEMVKRGWFPGFQGTVSEARTHLEDLMTDFVGLLGPSALRPALNRQHVRNGSTQDEYALTAWRIRVANLAQREPLPTYKSGTVSIDFLRELVRLSYLDAGPLLAKEFLNKSGIHVIVERHLPKTHLDGAVMKLPDGTPVVGITLRHDRLDNFWFTLFHELAHLALHLDNGETQIFFDDLSESGEKDRIEKETDNFASEALIANSDWKAAKLSTHSSITSLRTFAEKLRISPSIPAGRVRFESGNYKVFKTLTGNGKVRTMFGTGL